MRQHRQRDVVVHADHLHLTRPVQEHVGMTIGQDTLHAIGMDALLPAARHDRSPGLWWRPLAVGVRFVQDPFRLTRDASTMEQHVSIFSIRVEDLETETRYYVDGLGWRPLLAVPGEVTFLQVAPGLALSLFDANGFDADAGRSLRFPFTLSHNVSSEKEVRDVVTTMVEAGGTVVKQPQP